ncbi:MAG: urea transporter [Acidimicrobiales bacterium]
MMTHRMMTQTPTIDSRLDVFRDPLPGAATSPYLRFVDRMLRGVSQVVFQSNWLTGLLILAAIGFNSPPYLVAALVGTAVSTLTAVALSVDRGLIDAGLLGFNGCLAGIGLNFYLSQDITAGDWPGTRAYLFIILAAAFTTVIFGALGSLLGCRSVPALTAPFVFGSWLFLFGVFQFADLHPGSPLVPVIPADLTTSGGYTAGTVWNATFKGIGEIFFQDNAVSGVIMAVAVLVNTRIGALMMVAGPVVAALVAMGFGADAGAVDAGLYGFNASLTAIALGGFFYVSNPAGMLYTLFGVLVTTFVWPAFAVALAPVGMPTFTFPFVLTTWFFLLAKPAFGALRPVAPADATYPEDNLRRYRRGELAPGF